MTTCLRRVIVLIPADRAGRSHDSEIPVELSHWPLFKAWSMKETWPVSICCVQADKMFLGKLRAKCDSGKRWEVRWNVRNVFCICRADGVVHIHTCANCWTLQQLSASAAAWISACWLWRFDWFSCRRRLTWMSKAISDSCTTKVLLQATHFCVLYILPQQIKGWSSCLCLPYCRKCRLQGPGGLWWGRGGQTETCHYSSTFESRTIYYEQEYQTRERKKVHQFHKRVFLQFDHLNASSTERMTY